MDKPTTYPKILLGNRPQTLSQLYTNKSRWAKHHSGQDGYDNAVAPNDVTAVRWCLTGGIELVYDYTPRAREVVQILLAWIQAHPATENEQEEAESIQAWNDNPETTFKDIRKAVTELGI